MIGPVRIRQLQACQEEILLKLRQNTADQGITKHTTFGLSKSDTSAQVNELIDPRALKLNYARRLSAATDQNSLRKQTLPSQLLLMRRINAEFVKVTNSLLSGLSRNVLPQFALLVMHSGTSDGLSLAALWRRQQISQRQCCYLLTRSYAANRGWCCMCFSLVNDLIKNLFTSVGKSSFTHVFSTLLTIVKSVAFPRLCDSASSADFIILL